jgi:major membrane immunogen (membrane-anchored lipoprotein)
MKTFRIFSIPFIIVAMFIAFSFNKGDINKSADATLKDTSYNYLDGTYDGISRASYTSEPFWGHLQVSVLNGSFTDVRFMIRDSNLNEYVDSIYGVNNYSSEPLYMQQCVNDGKGIKIYPQRLVQSQDIDNVDAVSGATWSYNIFIASTKDALKNAKKNTAIETQDQPDKLTVIGLPNPFYSVFTLQYNITEKCHVNLCIYDMQGKMVKQLVDQEQHAGQYAVQWSDCPLAGMYFYQLQANNQISTGKLIKL